MTEPEIRIDKYLWATRIFKTRSIATDECRKGRITVNGTQVKPSHIVRKGEKIGVRKLPVQFTFEVLDITGNRLPAKLVHQFLADLTTEEERNKLMLKRSSVFGIRPKGFGRPTKKERRKIDRLNDNFSF